MNTETPLPLTLADRHEAQWHARCAEFEKFVDEHGRRPNANDPSSVQSLANWVMTNVAGRKQNKVSPARSPRFDSVMARCTTVRAESPGRLAKIQDLAEFVKKNGHTPTPRSTDPHESALGKFLVYSLRPDIRKGTIHKDSRAFAQQIPGVIGTGENRKATPAGTRIAKLRALAAFVDVAGRLPMLSSKYPNEHALAKFLIHSLRPDIRNGAIHPDALALAQKIPGATAIQTQPTSSERLAETRQFLEMHGCRPKLGPDAPVAERALASWISSHTSGGGAGITTATLALYREVDELIAPYPSASELRQLKRLDELEAFIMVHGHLPARLDKTNPESATQNALASWLRYTEKKDMDEKMRLRLRQTMTAPSREAFRWRQKLSEVATLDGDLKNGSGPWFWHQAQKFAYETGTLLPWQIELFSVVTDGLPELVSA